MKIIHVACLASLVPVLALAQSASYLDTTPKLQPAEPVLPQDHTGLGRIGVRLIYDKLTNIPQIVAITRGGPAEEFGFKVGDYIIKIDKNYTNTLSQDEVSLALHGQPGTGVELTVRRNDDPHLIVRALERRILPAGAEDKVNPSVSEIKVPDMTAAPK